MTTFLQNNKADHSNNLYNYHCNYSTSIVIPSSKVRLSTTYLCFIFPVISDIEGTFKQKQKWTQEIIMTVTTCLLQDIPPAWMYLWPDMICQLVQEKIAWGVLLEENQYPGTSIILLVTISIITIVPHKLQKKKSILSKNISAYILLNETCSKVPVSNSKVNTFRVITKDSVKTWMLEQPGLLKSTSRMSLLMTLIFTTYYLQVINNLEWWTWATDSQLFIMMKFEINIGYQELKLTGFNI